VAVALIPIPPTAADAPRIHEALTRHAAATRSPLPSSRWINPDHITSLKPHSVQGENDVELVADIKLQGLPPERWHFGHYEGKQQADDAFLELIVYIVAHTSDPTGRRNVATSWPTETHHQSRPQTPAK